MSLAEFANGSLTVILSGRFSGDPTTRAEISLWPQDGFADCPILSGNIRATLNGVPTPLLVNGGVYYGYEGGGSCHGIPFIAELEALQGSPGSPDGEFVLSDGRYTMKLTVRNLVISRTMTRVTSAPDLRPGGQMRFSWQPQADTLVRGSVSLAGVGRYSYSFDARIESNEFIVDLPAKPWPEGAVISVAGIAATSVARCEGIRTCRVTEIMQIDTIELPTL